MRLPVDSIVESNERAPSSVIVVKNPQNRSSKPQVSHSVDGVTLLAAPCLNPMNRAVKAVPAANHRIM